MRLRMNSGEPQQMEATPPVAPLAKMPRPRIGELGPRPVRERRGVRIILALFAGIALFTVTFGPNKISEDFRENRMFVAQGQLVPAKVLSTRRTHGESNHYYVTYQLPPEYQERVVEDRVNKSTYEGLLTGDQLDVTVLSGDPALHRVGPVTEENVRRDLAMGILLLFLGLAASTGMAGALVAVSRREMKALQDWPAVSAQVLTVKASAAGEEGRTYRLTVRYVPPRGAPMEVPIKITRSGKWSIAPGDFVEVLLDPDRPDRPRLLESFTTAEVIVN